MNQFQPSFPFEYPEGNTPDFETYFLQRYKYVQNGEGRIYIPVLWTSYQIRAKYGRDRKSMQILQNWINSLDRSKKYFTIVQYDDGILCKLRHLDVKVYAMSGPQIDYPLPLICQPHKYEFNEERTIRANFMGRMTHSIRKRIVMLRNKPGMHIPKNILSTQEYCRILSKSIFTLCPRGYGPSSFRIMEAMQYGSIPVYISDRFIYPHGIDFNQYGYIFQERDMTRLYKFLMSIPDEEIKFKQDAVKRCYEKLYTFDATMNFILEDLKVKELC